ncbi:class Ib ribonucleoside-diphosphate reductase assembly flavoprotein NrdI [Mechercharimyces sp. CAU 1602]|uniref:class Ib ribonucleoside-diphosphate reductase assembly flavoprotein NrdI n=1 Tax=Mechercharimyces sp. CAU 1602 TaxID=2973933 RepID=UPI002163D7BE|nr:class Ib ribonucleoside-diphosphate reductase assembly flavoprotein NrdI [Mechercharimyces sp. CAU 1602]MCS1350922.1 class Ib ribonucleoside-diphosphate reductase assembly flavoprotein NrdI [Mechercharimyces sp. CAU 1602]
MRVIYDSKTGNVDRLIQHLGWDAQKIEPNLTIDEPYVLITFTTGFGQVPPTVETFLQKNGDYLRGVAASGNRNFAQNFARSADVIAEQYQVPVLHKFELSGTPTDREIIKERVERLQHETYRVKQRGYENGRRVLSAT